VAEEDLLHAQAVLRDLRGRREEIDWSQVDVGEPEEPHVPDAAGWSTTLRFWRRVVYVIVIVVLVVEGAGVVTEIAGMVLRAIGVGP
jgi:hypothetical protein